MTTLTVRQATTEDAVATARCQFACWREAYADLAGDEVLARRTADPDRRARLWRRLISTGERTWRARRFYTRHGFVPAGTAKHDPAFGLQEMRMVRRAAGR
ncbi:MAG: hypothetical protein H0V13_09230 [Nocardioidaceae bacterium]|nr:hypothetical protein [Nocardioidaceae bacterium]